MANGLILVDVKGVVSLINKGLPLAVVDFAAALRMNQGEIVV
jgi:hypothetical protein